MDGFDEARTVKVLNISSRATQRLFNIFFEPCGKLTRVHISAPADESPEKRGGWALVEFDTTTAAQTALRFSGSDFLRHKVTIVPYDGSPIDDINTDVARSGSANRLSYGQRSDTSPLSANNASPYATTVPGSPDFTGLSPGFGSSPPRQSPYDQPRGSPAHSSPYSAIPPTHTTSQAHTPAKPGRKGIVVPTSIRLYTLLATLVVLFVFGWK